MITLVTKGYIEVVNFIPGSSGTLNVTLEDSLNITLSDTLNITLCNS